MKAVTEHIFNGITSPTGATYNTGVTYIGSGTFIKQYTGATAADNYISPFPIAVARPMEAATAIACAYPWVYSWSDDIDWIFLADNGTVATTRRFILVEYNKIINEFSWKGFITQSGPGGNETVRGMRAYIYKHTTGTVGVSNTAVTGDGTTWVNERIAAGARIGFGSTDPVQITNWYEISTINSNTEITLLSSAGTITTGTSYVIEEIRIYMTLSNATVANGGLFIIKGLNYSTFIPAGTTISLAASDDNVRAVYWLKDAAIVTMQAAWGMAYEQPNTGFTEHFAYVMNGTVSANAYHCYKYNLRANLTVSGGISTDAYLYRTGNIGSALTGTIIITNNGRVMKLNHGSGSGVESLYFVTTTRIYRCPLADITNGSTSYIADAMVDVPPGGTSTYIAAGFTGVEHISTIDKIVTSGAAAGRAQVGDYNTISEPFDVIFLANQGQYDSSLVDSGAPINPSSNAIAMSLYSEGGRLYLCRNGTSVALNQLYCLPAAAHRFWADESGEYVITPKILTTGAIKYYRVYVNSLRQLGNTTFGVPAEDYDLLYRTTGIDDNSGSWTLFADDAKDLSGISGSDGIQFKIRFKVLGTWCISPRIYSVSVVYEDSQTDSHYTPSVNKSNVTNRIFAYRQTSAWGSNIPNLRMRLYNAATNGSVLDDTITSSSSGTWQYSADGNNWNVWDDTKDTVGYYIRYTATTLPDSIIVRALLTQ
jgi:hypothetical protein